VTGIKNVKTLLDLWCEYWNVQSATWYLLSHQWYL